MITANVHHTICLVMMQHAVYIIELLILTVTKHVGCQCRFFQVSYSHFRWIYRRYHTILVIYQTIDLLYFVSSQQQLYYRNIRLSCGPTVIWSIGIYHAIFSFYANDFSQLISNNMKSAQAILSLITLLESGIDWGKWYYAIIFFTHRL